MGYAELLGPWGSRQQDAEEFAAAVQRTVERVTLPSGVWVEMQSRPDGGDYLTPVPVDVANRDAIVEVIRRRTDERWGGENPPNLVCDLDFRNTDAGGEEYPITLKVTASDSNGDNMIQLQLRAPETITDDYLNNTIRIAAEVWDPDWLCTWDFDLNAALREHGRKATDIQIGWKTYISDRAQLDTTNPERQRDSVETLPTGGHIITLSDSQRTQPGTGTLTASRTRACEHRAR